MHLLVTLEHRFQRTPDGAIWTATTHAYSFWKRYFSAFNRVTVLARVLDVPAAKPAWLRADGPRVQFAAVPHFIGPNQYALRYFQVEAAVDRALMNSEAIILRVPSLLGQIVWRRLKRHGRPYGLEVVGDPFDVFAPGSGVRHPLRPVFRSWFSRHLRRQCLDADAVAYVTKAALQRRYPSTALTVGISDVILPDSAFTTSYSSIELKRTNFLDAQFKQFRTERPVLVFVGSLEQLYKAPDVLINAMARIVAKGIDATLQIVGEGRYREPLQALAARLGIANRCRFLGQLPGGEAVQKVLDSSDLFVLPSRVEALPRALIEAMARGLPCIGSTVGGIPELLEPDYLVAPGDECALASKIAEVLADPDTLKSASERNLREARTYSEDILDGKRVEFYRHLAGITAQRLALSSAA